DLLNHANDVEIDSVQQDRASDRGASRKDVFQQFPPHHCDPAMIVIVFVVEPAAGADRHISNLVVGRRDSEDLAVGAPKFTDRANVFTVQNWRHGAQELGLIADRNVVVVVEVVFLSGLEAAFDRGNPTRKGEHDVLAQFSQILLLAAAETFAEPDQQEQRAYAPRNAEHGQKRAQLVRPKRSQGLADDVGKRSHVPSQKSDTCRGAPPRLFSYTKDELGSFPKL